MSEKTVNDAIAHTRAKYPAITDESAVGLRSFAVAIDDWCQVIIADWKQTRYLPRKQKKSERKKIGDTIIQFTKELISILRKQVNATNKTTN